MSVEAEVWLRAFLHLESHRSGHVFRASCSAFVSMTALLMFGAQAAAYSFHYLSCYDKKMFVRVQPPYLFSVLETDGSEECPGPCPKANCVCVCVCVCQTAPYLHAATVILRCSFTH